MPKTIYGGGKTTTKAAYTIPPNQNINTYVTQTNTILQDFKVRMDKDVTIERLQTLRQLMQAVVGQATAAPAPA